MSSFRPSKPSNLRYELVVASDSEPLASVRGHYDPIRVVSSDATPCIERAGRTVERLQHRERTRHAGEVRCL